MKPIRIKKKIKKPFMVRIDPELTQKVNQKRAKDKKEWSEIVEWLFNYYLEKL